MSLTDEAIANARYRLQEKRAQIDANPNVTMVRIALAIDKRTKRVRVCYVHVEEEHDALSAGLLLAESGDVRPGRGA